MSGIGVSGRSLIPHLYAFSLLDYSFAKIAGRFDQISLDMSVSTVRSYYSQLLPEQLEACEKERKQVAADLKIVRQEANALDQARGKTVPLRIPSQQKSKPVPPSSRGNDPSRSVALRRTEHHTHQAANRLAP